MDVAEGMRTGWVLDGGLATQLERLGADLLDELWSARVLLERPDMIRQAHEAYRVAGADVAITSSYQASYEGFSRRGIDAAGTDRLLALSVRLARDAGAEVVAASVGPYGASLADGSEYVGRYGRSVRELVEWHRPRLEALLAAEPDLLAIETIPAIEEVEALVDLLGSYPEARAWIACSCRDEERISDGTRFREAAMLAASAPGVIAVGVNCTPPGFVAPLLRTVPDVGLPLLAYPNLGSTWNPETKAWHAEGPRPDFEAGAVQWREAGARSVGGCCGTTPDDIAKVRAAIA